MSGFVTLRAASRDDAAELAILCDIAAHGLTSFIWLADARREGFDTPMECGRMRMRLDHARGGWRSAVVAEAYGEVAGVAVGYQLDENLDDVSLSHPSLLPVMELQKMAAAHWFIASLGVYHHMRGIGIGRRLLDDQIQKAGTRPVSLVTASDNDVALRLYRERGFSERARRDAARLFETSKDCAWVLLTRQEKEQRQETHG